MRYSASYRRRERLTPPSANRSWSFAPPNRVCQSLRSSPFTHFPRLTRLPVVLGARVDLSRYRSSCQTSLARFLTACPPCLVLGLVVRRRPFLRFLSLRRFDDKGLIARRFLPAVPKVALHSCERSLSSFNVQGSRAPGWKRLVQPAPCGIACSALLSSVAHLPLSLAKSLPPWLRPWVISPAEFVLAVSRTPFGLPCPSFFS